MKSSKEKLSNMVSAAKEHVDICGAKIDEKTEKARARTEEEKVIAHERAKAREAKAKMELHEAKARHAAEKLSTKQAHLDPSSFGAHHQQPPTTTHQQPLGSLATPAGGVTNPSYPLGGNHHINKHI
uniref:Lea protein 2 n=1 Tax=Arachis hypogaea TaxID=3818 RepID=Q45W84_ARAHY|nr:lea protein 2 [Arachis hypogaea]